MITSYRDLIVWQRAMELAVEVHRLTERFPPAERFGMSAQIRRATFSISSNLAEGHERHSRGDYRRHVSIALGSLAELENGLELARRLGFCEGDKLVAVRELTGEVGRMLLALLGKLRRPAGKRLSYSNSPAPSSLAP